MLSLVVSVLALQEFLRLQAISAPDMSSGTHVRKFFFALLGAQAFYRTVALVIETLAMPDATDANISAISIFVRCSPHLLYLSAHSILVLYWAQLCYALDNKPFFHIRNIFLAANISAYVVTLITFLLICGNMLTRKAFFCELALAFTATLVAMVTFFIRLIKLLPDQLISVKSIHTRLHPVTLTCCCSLFLGACYYWAILFNLVSSYFGHVSYENDEGIYVFDGVCVLLIETLPSLIIILLMARIDKPANTLPSRSKVMALGPRTSFTSPAYNLGKPIPAQTEPGGGLRFEQPVRDNYQAIGTQEM